MLGLPASWSSGRLEPCERISTVKCVAEFNCECGIGRHRIRQPIRDLEARKLKRILSALALCLLVSTLMFSLACQEKLPMSVNQVWEQAGGDANKLDEVMDRARVQELKGLHDTFEQERQGRIPSARMWAAYAKKAQEIKQDYDKLRDRVFDDFKNRSS